MLISHAHTHSHKMRAVQLVAYKSHAPLATTPINSLLRLIPAELTFGVQVVPMKWRGAATVTYTIEDMVYIVMIIVKYNNSSSSSSSSSSNIHIHRE